jgi:hypothetical protein
MSRMRSAGTGRLRYARAERRSEIALVTLVMNAASRMMSAALAYSSHHRINMACFR